MANHDNRNERRHSSESMHSVKDRDATSSEEDPRRRTLSPGNYTGPERRGEESKVSPSAQVVSWSPSRGERIASRYELIRCLGSGGMGAVWEARDLLLGRHVAIKLIHSPNEKITSRFVSEARITAQVCGHESIVEIHDVGEHNGQPYMVLELLRGHALSALHRKGQALAVARVAAWMVPVLKGLVHAHTMNVVHRDLKPDNLFETPSGIKIVDFGIAKLSHQKDDPPLDPGSEPLREAWAEPSPFSQAPIRTRIGEIIGTPLYMAPEQILRGGEVDSSTDMWAIGIILYEFLTGVHPLADHTLDARQFFGCLARPDPVPSLREKAPKLAARLCAIIDRCLSKKKALRPTAQELLQELESYLPSAAATPLAQDECPYPGLAAFQETASHLLFGRDAEIGQLVTRVREQPITTLAGISGAGKSSIVRAGLLPALRLSGECWATVILRPGRHPIASLAGALRGTLARSEPEAEIAKQLAERPAYLGALLRDHCRRLESSIVVVVDQAEELFSLGSDRAETDRFLAALSSAADDVTSPIRLVLTIRSDYLDRLAEHSQAMAAIAPGLMFLSAPSAEGLREAIVKPAARAGYQLESEEIVDAMLGHLARTPGALPLLQFVAVELWKSRDKQRRLLTVASYQALGGIEGALSRRADEIIARIPASKTDLVRQLFLRLVTGDRTLAIAELAELRAELGEGVEAIVDLLAQERLVVVQQQRDSVTVELVHDSLIRCWATLQQWLDQDGGDARFLEQLRLSARQWNALGRRAASWPADLVAQARTWKERYRGEVPEEHQSFLKAVFAAHDKALRRRRTLIASSIAVSVTLTIASLGVAVVIKRSRDEAIHQAEEARVARRDALGQRDAAEKAREVAEMKEHERAQAAALAAQAAALAEAAKSEAEQKNAELVEALDVAADERRHARAAQRQAETARAEAMKAAKALSVELAKQKQRADRLQAQYGTASYEQLMR